jgi:hypothetical protein
VRKNQRCSHPPVSGGKTGPARSACHAPATKEGARRRSGFGAGRGRGGLRLGLYGSMVCKPSLTVKIPPAPFEKGGAGGISIVILVPQKKCHPESPASPPVSSRTSAARDLQLRTQADEGLNRKKTRERSSQNFDGALLRRLGPVDASSGIRYKDPRFCLGFEFLVF